MSDAIPTPIEPRSPGRSIQLTIKSMSLLEESRIIRRYEAKLRQRAGQNEKTKQDLASIQSHRATEIRGEARDTFLAHAFLRGRPYNTVESLRYSEPNWKNIARMCERYRDGGDLRLVRQEFEEWKQAAPPVKEKPVRHRSEGRVAGSHPTASVESLPHARKASVLDRVFEAISGLVS